MESKIQINIILTFFDFVPKKNRPYEPITDLLFLQGRQNYLTWTPYLVGSDSTLQKGKFMQSDYLLL